MSLANTPSTKFLNVKWNILIIFIEKISNFDFKTFSSNLFSNTSSSSEGCQPNLSSSRNKLSKYKCFFVTTTPLKLIGSKSCILKKIFMVIFLTISEFCAIFTAHNNFLQKNLFLKNNLKISSQCEEYLFVRILIDLYTISTLQSACLDGRAV